LEVRPNVPEVHNPYRTQLVCSNSNLEVTFETTSKEIPGPIPRCPPVISVSPTRNWKKRN